MRVRTFFCIFALLGLMMSATTSLGQAKPGRANPITIPLTPYMGLLYTTDVSINSKKYTFLFDTGGGLTFVDKGLLQEMACDQWGRAVGFKMSGERVDAPTCGKRILKIGDLQVEVEIFGADIRSGIPKGYALVDGVLSLHTFKGLPITIDLASNKLIVETKDSMLIRTASMRTIETRISNQSGGESIDLFAAINAGIRKLWYEVDSGYGGPAPIPSHAAQAMGLKLSSTMPSEISIPVKGLGNLPMKAISKEIIYDGVINAEAMKSIILTLDLAAGKSWALLLPKKQQ